MALAINRRLFMRTVATAAAVPAIMAESPWGGPVFDIHQHTRVRGAKDVDTLRLTDHLTGSGCAKAVLLPSRNSEDRVKAVMQQNRDRFVLFANADLSDQDAVVHLRSSIKDGAIGIGELSYAGMLDAPEARRIYELASEFHVPVLIHFEENRSFSGFRRLPAILKEYKRTTFIGHANSWWAHISSEVDDKIGYPTGRIKPGGLTDKMLADYPNIYGDLSANSGRNALARDPDFAADFIARHRNKLMFGSDCGCRDGHGDGQPHPLLKGKCTARETLTLLKGMSSPELFRRITWDNATKLLKVSNRSKAAVLNGHVTGPVTRT